MSGPARAAQVRRALERLLARQVVAALAGVRAGGLRGAVEPELGALLGTLRLSAAVPALSVRAQPCWKRVRARPCWERVFERHGCRPAGAAAGPRGAAPARVVPGSTLRASCMGRPARGTCAAAARCPQCCAHGRRAGEREREREQRRRRNPPSYCGTSWRERGSVATAQAHQPHARAAQDGEWQLVTLALVRGLAEARLPALRVAFEGAAALAALDAHLQRLGACADELWALMEAVLPA